MNKLKTNKAAQKRFRVTKSGKIMRGHQMNSHLKTKKKSDSIRRRLEPTEVSKTVQKTLERLLPYGAN